MPSSRDEVLQEIIDSLPDKKPSVVKSGIPYILAISLFGVILQLGKVQEQFEQMQQQVNVVLPRKQTEILDRLEDITEDMDARFSDSEYRVTSNRNRIGKNNLIIKRLVDDKRNTTGPTLSN